MKTKTSYFTLLLFLLLACRKETRRPEETTTATASLSLEQVKASQTDTRRHLYWDKAIYIAAKPNPYWLVGFPGRPRFDSLGLGYRSMIFYKNKDGKINSRILEIIPDVIYLQRKKQISQADFTGRVFTYDPTYHLLYGRIYVTGKLAGEIKPLPPAAKPLKADRLEPVVTCGWTDNNYVDGDGNAVIYSERLCAVNFLDMGSGDGPGSPDPFSGQPAAPTAGGGAAPASAPEPSNLPDENKNGINPKDFMKCFQNMPDNGAIMKITIYVQEPWPGTTFNVGPNSVGHTAISLTKSNGRTSITQTVGFYPDASGLDKMHAPSKIVDNGGDLEYNVSITYQVTAENFNRIVNYISNPPATYDITEFNCTSFVNSACLAGNVIIPNPFAYSSLYPAHPVPAPAALGSSIAQQKGDPNVNTTGGTTPFSKGPCN